MSLCQYFGILCDAENCTTEPLYLDADTIADAILEAETAGWRYILNGGFACPACLARVGAIDK